MQYMMRNHLSATSNAASSRDMHQQGVLRGTSFGIGFGIVVDPAQAEVISSPGTYFWGGHAGTIFWIDPEEDLVAIAMMQLMASPWPFRNEMGVMTYQAIEKLNRAK
jgi:CubicO group peptidase (beta-lactamase class C family)